MIRRIARPLLGSIFIYTGYNHLRHPAAIAPVSEPLTSRATEILPESPVVPSDPENWVRALGGIQLGGGLLLAVGKFPRASALTLAGTMVPVTAIGHPFWKETDPALRQQATIEFLKNASIAGGLIIAGFDTEGKPGVVWRTKRVAGLASDKAAAAVAAVKPGVEAGAPALRDRAEERAHELSGAAQDAADKVGQQLTQARDVAGKYANQATEKAAPVVSDLAETAASKASELAAVASSRLAEARDKAPEVAENAKQLFATAQGKAQDKAPEVAENAKQLFATAQGKAQDKAPEVAENARHLFATAQAKAQAKAPEVGKQARRRFRFS